MKKLSYLLIVLCVILVFTACGEKPVEPDPLPQQGNASSAEETPVPPTADAGQAQSSEKPTGTPPGHEFLGSVEDPVVVDDAEIPAFSFDVMGVLITDEDMAEYPVYSVTTTSTNTYGTTTTRVYIGYTMADVLDAAGITEDFKTLTTIADDGYTIKVNKDIALEPTTLVAVSEDGKMFRDGLWFAPCSSNVSPDYLRELTEVIID